MLADKDLTLQRLQEDTELCDDKVLRYIRWYKSLPLAEQNIIYLQHLGLRNKQIAELYSVSPQYIKLIIKRIKDKRNEL